MYDVGSTPSCYSSYVVSSIQEEANHSKERYEIRMLLGKTSAAEAAWPRALSSYPLPLVDYFLRKTCHAFSLKKFLRSPPNLLPGFFGLISHRKLKVDVKYVKKGTGCPRDYQYFGSTNLHAKLLRGKCPKNGIFPFNEFK